MRRGVTLEEEAGRGCDLSWSSTLIINTGRPHCKREARVNVSTFYTNDPELFGHPNCRRGHLLSTSRPEPS